MPDLLFYDSHTAGSKGTTVFYTTSLALQIQVFIISDILKASLKSFLLPL